jgi:putative peptidoglycan lipid II flippase
LSAYVDLIYASFISERAIAALTYAQTIYLVPFSLFGMSVSAAELPAMAQESDKPAEKLRERISNSLSRVAFFVVPSTMAFFLLGDVIAAALLQTGKFTSSETRYVWLLLAGATVGLLASTFGRLYSSAFYALKDTKTPLQFAVVRVGLGAILAFWAVKKSAAVFGFPMEWGAVGITAASGIAAWVEYAFLKATLVRRIGPMGVPWKRLLTLWAIALVAGLAGLGVKAGLAARFGTESTNSLWAFLSPPAIHPVLTAAAVLLPFGGLYFLLTAVLGVPQARSILGRFFPSFR